MNVQKVLKEIDELIIDREYELAEKYLLQLIEKYPDHPEVHYLLGDVYCKLEKFDIAVKHEKIAYKILPGNPQIIHLLGWAYFMSGDIASGREYMEKSLELLPDELIF